MTPRPVGRMGAVRACLKRRHSSAPVHARRAEGRALAGPEEGSGALGARRRWLAPVFSGVLRPDWPAATPRSPRPLERPQRPRCRRSERQKAPCGPATGGARRVDSERAPAVAVRRAARPPHEWLDSGGHARRARACSRGQRGVWAWANARRRPRGAAWAGLGRGARGARAWAVVRSVNRARLRGAAAGRHGRGIDARRGWEACCKPPPSASRKPLYPVHHRGPGVLDQPSRGAHPPKHQCPPCDLQCASRPLRPRWSKSPAKQGEAGSQHAGGAQAPNLRSGSRVHASAICPPHRLQRPPPQFSFALKKKARSRKLSSPCVLGDCLRGAGPSAISTSAEALPPPVRPH